MRYDQYPAEMQHVQIIDHQARSLDITQGGNFDILREYCCAVSERIVEFFERRLNNIHVQGKMPCQDTERDIASFRGRGKLRNK